MLISRIIVREPKASVTFQALDYRQLHSTVSWISDIRMDTCTHWQVRQSPSMVHSRPRRALANCCLNCLMKRVTENVRPQSHGGRMQPSFAKAVCVQRRFMWAPALPPAPIGDGVCCYVFRQLSLAAAAVIRTMESSKPNALAS